MKTINLGKGFKLQIPDCSLKCEHSFESDKFGMPKDCECGMPYKILCLIPEKKARGRKRVKDINNPTHGVENIAPIFNRGLGCVTYGTRDAERKAKALGLRPIGDAKPHEFKQEKIDNVMPILKEGMAKIRANRIKNGEM